jgi:outer membrane protein assembly factor BamD (BamD/ComL family)
MERLYRKMGRDNEIKNIQEYLDNNKEDGFVSDDDDEDDNGSFF